LPAVCPLLFIFVLRSPSSTRRHSVRYRREKRASCGPHPDASPKVTGGRLRSTRRPSKPSSMTPKATR